MKKFDNKKNEKREEIGTVQVWAGETLEKIMVHCNQPTLSRKYVAIMNYLLNYNPSLYILQIQILSFLDYHKQTRKKY